MSRSTGVQLPPGKKPIHRMLRSNGRIVIVYEKIPFSVPIAFEQELDDGIISEAFRAELSNHDVQLSPGATIPIREPGRKWLIRNDDGRWYTVTREDGEEGEEGSGLKVYCHKGKIVTKWLKEAKFLQAMRSQKRGMKTFDQQIHSRPLPAFLRPSP